MDQGHYYIEMVEMGLEDCRRYYTEVQGTVSYDNGMHHNVKHCIVRHEIVKNQEDYPCSFGGPR